MDQICTRLTSKLLIALFLSVVISGTVCAQTPKPAAPSPTPAASKPASLSVETPVPADKVVLKVGDRQLPRKERNRWVINMLWS
jgi:hypothetical protein